MSDINLSMLSHVVCCSCCLAWCYAIFRQLVIKWWHTVSAWHSLSLV